MHNKYSLKLAGAKLNEIIYNNKINANLKNKTKYKMLSSDSHIVLFFSTSLVDNFWREPL